MIELRHLPKMGWLQLIDGNNVLGTHSLYIFHPGDRLRDMIGDGKRGAKGSWVITA